MLASYRIKSTTEKPVQYKDYISINVLKWNNSKWKALCPYYLETDGNEIQKNDGGILFENYYQASKIYTTVYTNTVYASQYHQGNPKYLWWSFTPTTEGGDIISDGQHISYDLYNRWKKSLWNCKKPIRYPNKKNRTSQTLFSLLIDKDGNEQRLDYLSARKLLYVNEYMRLIRQLPQYTILLNYLKEGKNLLISEIDVPDKNKKGEYGKHCNELNVFDNYTIGKIELLLNDPHEAFGHGLCLIYALLQDNN